MDFGNFEVEAANASQLVHLQVDGKPLYWTGSAITVAKTDMPCRVHLRGAGSNEVYQAFRKYQIAEAAQARRVERAKDGDLDDLEARHADRLEGLLDDLIVAAVCGWEHVQVDGSEECTQGKIRVLIDRTSGAKRQIRMQLFKAIVEKRDVFSAAASV